MQLIGLQVFANEPVLISIEAVHVIGVKCVVEPCAPSPPPARSGLILLARNVDHYHQMILLDYIGRAANAAESANQ